MKLNAVIFDLSAEQHKRHIVCQEGGCRLTRSLSERGTIANQDRTLGTGTDRLADPHTLCPRRIITRSFRGSDEHT